MKGVGIKNSSVRLTESAFYGIKPRGVWTLKDQKRGVKKCINEKCFSKRSDSPLSAKVWMASQALTRISSSGELSSSTAVAGVLLSTARGSNC